jgi:alkylation response protein AidB-like acyl-CoA dehydrogenase
MIAETWLEPIRPMLAKWVQTKDWKLLLGFEQSLREVAQDKSSQQPLQVKASLASKGYAMVDIETRLGGKGCSPVLQALLQFICGYHDLDFRDVAHVGHGRMIILHGSEQQQKLWTPELAKGSLVGIAATEVHGGSRIQNTKTVARRNGKAHLLNGEKVYISRIKEAETFVVFFKFEKDETLSAALIDLSRKGVKAELWEPLGLRGWSWGKVVFENAPFTDQDVLGARGQGMAIFKEHFAYYRPMVAITALGAAAAVLDQMMVRVNQRVSGKDISTPRDSCLEAIGNHYLGINAGILSALCAIVQNVENSPHASLWSRAVKAWSVEQAHQAVSELALFMGASAIRTDQFAAKTLCDLRAFLTADGIHDSLRRSAGRTLMDFCLRNSSGVNRFFVYAAFLW